MPDEKTPIPGDKPDYGPEPPARELLGDDNPQINEFEPERNRNVSSIAVLTTVVVVLLLGILYFVLR